MDREKLGVIGSKKADFQEVNVEILVLTVTTIANLSIVQVIKR